NTRLHIDTGRRDGGRGTAGGSAVAATATDRLGNDRAAQLAGGRDVHRVRNVNGFALAARAARSADADCGAHGDRARCTGGGTPGFATVTATAAHGLNKQAIRLNAVGHDGAAGEIGTRSAGIAALAP